MLGLGSAPPTRREEEYDDEPELDDEQGYSPVAFEDGHFELTVTCTSSTDRDQIAYANDSVEDVFLFPWCA